MTSLAWFILGIPLLSAATIFFFLRNQARAASLLSTSSMAVCFLLTLLLLPQYQAFVGHHAVESTLAWMALPGLHVEFGILLNGLTLLMLFIVTGIGSLIFLYSMSYMKEDPGCARYFACLSLFAFSMLGIVLSNNLIQIFIFWELVGLSSYLLIGFWFDKPSASTAGKKAFLTTRVGDVGMMIGILVLYGFMTRAGHSTFNFLQIEHTLSGAAIPAGWLTFIAICLFLGVAGKSAQVPLHVWLPDAMEGPTPVSALIHAATMVAAGVFLLARLTFLYALSPDASQWIAWIGIITAFLAGTIAIVQNDIKRILAYSTLSQLGYMVMAMGLNAPEAGMFHLTTHAFFKALLFLGAGSLIHAFHTQDIWQMRTPGLLKKMPVTAFTFLIGTFALMGIPPLSGFYSKEAVLAAAQAGHPLLFILSLAVVFLTAFYMGRLTTALFLSPEHDSHAHEVHEADWKIQAPLALLGVLSVVGGFFPIQKLVTSHADHAAHHGDATLLLLLSIGLALAGFVLAIFIYRRHAEGLSQMIPALKISDKVLERKYFFDDLYDAFITFVQENIAKSMDWIERLVIVQACVNGVALMTREVGNRVRKFQNGIVQFYALLFTLGAGIIIYWLILGGIS